MRRSPLTLAQRRMLDRFIQAAIDLLDDCDAATMDREPDADAEIVSEDDGVVVGLRPVGRQWA